MTWKEGSPDGSVVKNPPADARRRRRLRFDPLEEEVVTHSSVPAWRIPWTEEPVLLGSQS